MKKNLRFFNYYPIISTLLFFFIIVSCNQKLKKENPYNLDIVSDITVYQQLVKENPDKELIDLEKFIPGIALDIRYATENNFTGEIVYKATKAYVRRPVGEALQDVQNELEIKGLAVKIFDAYRPYSATMEFYRVYPDTIFVAAPWKGSVHNRGCAVDLTLIDLKNNKELEMPTLFDDFTEKASHEYMDLSVAALENRKILREIMIKHGFSIYKNEWWHYNYKGYKNFKLMNIYFEEI